MGMFCADQVFTASPGDPVPCHVAGGHRSGTGEPVEAGSVGGCGPARGELLRCRLAEVPAFEYLAYCPRGWSPGMPILVSVHGISRNAEEHLRLMAPLADRYRVALLAPRFTEEQFPAYQRLVRGAGGEHPDRLLRQAVREFSRATGAESRRLYLFGYSGGAQFVHRMVMRQPDDVAGYALGAAGWYTMPDRTQRYPYGLGRNRRLGVGGFDPAAFLRVPGVVLVGERDRHPGTALRRTDRVRESQGDSRLERAQRWVEAMNAAAAEQGLPQPLHFEALPRSPHSFARSMRRGAMGERVFAALFGAPADDSRVPAAVYRSD